MQAESGAVSAARAVAGGPPGGFRLRDIHTSPLVYKLFNWAFDYPQRERWMGFLRRFWPIAWLPPHWYLVMRDEDVREVLAHDAEFPVSWGAKMKEVTGQENFVLGMKRDDQYRTHYGHLAKAFPLKEACESVPPLAFDASTDILGDKKEIDAVRELMWGVPARLCETYYGIRIDNHLLLAEWTIAMSSYLFGLPKEGMDGVPPADDVGRVVAREAADAFRAVIRRAIRETEEGNACGVVLPRLLAMKKAEEPGLTREVIEAHLFGMVTGFIPTNLLVGGNILETLLRNEEYLERTRAAALADDDGLLWRCLQEALRFRFFNPGPFRVCPNGYTLAAGTERETHIPPGSRLVVMTPSAMFDRRRVKDPHKFDPDRPADDYLIFGYGQHWCLGAYIAIAQLTQTFKALLRKEGLRRKPGKQGKLEYITVYPAHLWVEFDA
jgi:cytochrome P450